jgi:hypothetical protein
VEVYRLPIPDPTGEFEFVYGDVQIYKPGQVLAPLAAPQARISVDKLLP